MLTRRVIPCLDVRDGRVVKGVKFQNLRDAGDPGGAGRGFMKSRGPTRSGHARRRVPRPRAATNQNPTIRVRRAEASWAFALTVGRRRARGRRCPRPPVAERGRTRSA